jgi:hypothetical protein
VRKCSILLLHSLCLLKERREGGKSNGGRQDSNVRYIVIILSTIMSECVYIYSMMFY